MPSLKAKLFAAASQDTDLTGLLGNNPFRWYDTQLQQGTAFPCVEVRLISSPRTYAFSGRLPTGWSRVQFTIFGSGTDSESADAVAQVLAAFLDTFNAIGVPGLTVYPCQIVGDRDSGIAQTKPLTWQRIIDVQIFSNDSA